MKQQSALNWLVPLIAVLAVVSAGAGLFWQDEGSPYTFTTLYGEAVMVSPGGITTKVPQLLLEATLIYLIVTDWLRWRSEASG
jgi:hypothetical protein